ncbi:MAG: class I SAM-dependent methyltransferase [Bryobacteraceae bacterium]|nr:class I SAM-dependent methyltransferase [Bryobacteraceae bacterium]
MTTSEPERKVHTKRTECRVCGGQRLRMFLSLGPMPLANAFLRTPDEFETEPRFPLDVYFCEDCSLAQLLDVIDPATLFRNYIYVTGTSATIAAHNREYARTVVETLGLGARDLVVEIASNDGSLLRCFQEHGVRTLGIEPARNIAEQARAAGVDTVDQFFDAGLAREVRAGYGPAKAIIGNNVLAHVDETRDFLRGAKDLLAEDGRVIIEVPEVREMIQRLEYDTVYHEHLCYFSATTLMRLCDAVGLKLARVDRMPVHGGSLRIWAGVRAAHSEDACALAAEERELGLGDFGRYERFAADAAKNREAILALLGRLKAEGKTVAGYGAPAKGNTLLNYCGIGVDLLPYTVDKNPMKVGLYTPGMHIPVLPAAALAERRPDYALILPWNIAGEIIEQQEAYRRAGGRFIVPVPEPKVI